MGLFDFLFGKPAPTKRRGPSRSPAERQKLEELRYLQELKRTNRQAYDEMMMKRLGLGTDHKDELAQLQGTVKKLRELGLIKSANDIDGGGGAWLKDAVAGLGILLQQMQIQPRVALPAAQEPIPPAERPQPAQAQPTPPSEEDSMDMMSRYLVSQLSGKTPEQAAAWLAGLPYPQARQLVEQLCRTPDPQVPAFLAQLGQAAPAWRGALTWLQGQGELWVLSTVRELRRLTGHGVASSIGF